MKTFFTISILLMFFAVSTSIAQTNWTKYLGNPVLTPGSSISWEGYEVYAPFVLKDQDTLKMWYTGSRSYDLDHIGYATSTDGIQWQRYHANPVLLTGTPGSWDDEVVSHSKIILIDTTYHMWYGGTGVRPYYNYSAGYATSPDGKNWTKYDDPSTTNPSFAESDPVLTPGAPGSWDSATLAGASFFFDGDTFHVWYGACDSQDWSNGCIGYAKSHDGINWVKYAGNPVFCGSGNSWDSFNSIAPCVVVDSSGYKMWYQGSDGSHTRIGYAISSDGINWTAMNNYVLDMGNPGNWDDDYVSNPHVIFNDTTYSMWYAGGRVNSGTRIGYATAPVTINVPNDYTTIQEAINAAHDGNVVLVADGTYQENINFKGKAIIIASHFYVDGDTSHISNTIIDGSNPSNPDSGSTVYFVSGEDTNSVLQGFTITNGTGTITIYGYQVRSGGGIFCLNSGASIKNNNIVNNSVSHNDASGGGIGVIASSIRHINVLSNNIYDNLVNGVSTGATGGGIFFANISGKIIGNVIYNNSVDRDNGQASGGGVSLWHNAPQPPLVIIKENQVSYNSANGVDIPGFPGAWGGGLNILKVTAQVYNNRITHNDIGGTVSAGGAGLCLHTITNTTSIKNNFIAQNNVLQGTGMGGGIIIVSGNPFIENNIISHNSASNGGGIEVANSTNPAIINNTIINNNALVQGGGIYTTNSFPIVVNSILWGNSPDQISRASGGLVDAIYNIVQGGYTGNGNLNIDPLFVPGDSLYHVMCTTDTSQCLNRGIDSVLISGTWYFAPTSDFAGDPRPQPIGTRPDIGAFEYGVINRLEEIQNIQMPLVFSLKQNYPNPFNPKTTIEFSIPKVEYVSLKIYNLLGQEVSTLVSKKLTAGEYKYTWDASHLASGIYIYKLEAGNYNNTKKLILLK